MNKENFYDKFNIMIIGDEKVGKSTIIERYVKNLNKDISIKNSQVIENKQWVLNVTKKQK
jgi:GTPase SAR1 family protein